MLEPFATRYPCNSGVFQPQLQPSGSIWSLGALTGLAISQSQFGAGSASFKMCYMYMYLSLASQHQRFNFKHVKSSWNYANHGSHIQAYTDLHVHVHVYISHVSCTCICTNVHVAVIIWKEQYFAYKILSTAARLWLKIHIDIHVQMYMYIMVLEHAGTIPRILLSKRTNCEDIEAHRRLTSWRIVKEHDCIVL